MKKINTKNLEEWKLDNCGECKEVTISDDNYIALVCTNKTVFLFAFEDSNDDTFEVGVTSTGDITDITRIIKLEDDVQIADIDLCTSEGTIYLTNGKKLYLELLRDDELIDSDDYYRVVKGINVEYK